MKTIDCMSRDTLKHYLAGWMDEPQTAEIEQHLVACETCEQTVIELESKPDTIFDPLRQRGPSPTGIASADPMLREAVESLEQLVKSAGRPMDNEMQPARSTVGPYQLLRQLGHGGMGTVYLAKHKQLGKQVAMKMLPASWSASEEAVARFRREILAVGKLNHASIVSATDAGEQEGMHYLVMEYVDGIDLSQLARSVGPLEIAEACEMMRQVACGLSYAHAEGVVHRDVKPSNVMLSDCGQVKVLDFGLAQLNPWDEAASELTSVGQLMGTLDYMAPEQAEQPSAVDYRADLYSLGATLFRLLAGRAPLAAAPNLSPLHKLRLLAKHDPPRLDSLRPDAPPELVQLVASLLARQPEARPASAAHVAERLAPLCGGADLVALAVRARTAVEQTANTPDRSNQIPFPQVGLAATPRNQRTDHKRRWTVGFTLVGLAAMALFPGVLIVLETRKGQLIIESEVPNVHVKLLSDGRVTDEMQLSTGTTSTRLAADKYEIVLDSPSDSITIDKSTFVLKSGGTIIARVRQREATLPRDFFPASGSASKEPVYDGKTLGDWIDQLSRERSPKAIGEALVAIEALVQKDTADRITRALVSLLPSMAGDTRFSKADQTTSNVDLTAFAIVAKANPGQSYFELLAKLLEDADEAWGKRILSGILRKADASDEEMEPFLRWVETNALVGTEGVGAKRGLIEPSAVVIRLLLIADTSGKHNLGALEQRFLPLLEESQHLSAAFWLAVPPTPKWPAGLRRAVWKQALRALQDAAASPPIIAQATMILRVAMTDAASKSELNTSEVAGAVRTRLLSIAEDLPRMWQLSSVESTFREWAAPRPPSHLQLEVTGQSTASETMQLLDLVAVLQSNGESQFELAKIVKATSEAYLHVARELPELSRTLPRITIWWPSLSTVQFRGQPRSRASVTLAPTPTPTPTDWLGYLICSQASELAEIPLPTIGGEVSPTEPAAPPVDKKKRAP